MDALYLIASLSPWLAVALPLIGGLWAARRLRRPAGLGRTGVGRALAAAALLAVTIGGLTTFLVAALATIFFARPDYENGLRWGLPVAALVFLSALAGYEFLARRSSAHPIAGVLLGPLALIGGPFGLMFLAEELQKALR